jgi:3-oxoacyl-[acyl-carrier-protein] synthase-3
MHSDGASGGALTLMSRHRKGWAEEESAGHRQDAHPAGQDASGYAEEDLPIQSHVDQASIHPEEFIRMDGREVFRFAVKKVPEAIRELLEHSGMQTEQIDYFVLHQANRRIVESVAKRLDVEIEKFPMNLDEYGNTSSASIPILLDEMNRDGRLKPGQTIILSGFGAGLSWGAAVLKW